MTTQIKCTPKELITQGRADSVQSAKRVIEIQRLEQINSELLEACKEALAHFDKYTSGIVLDCKDSLRMAIKKAEATQ